MQFKAQEEFTQELYSVIEYYDRIDTELVNRFIQDLKDMRNHISLFPEASPPTEKISIRKYLLRNFPYRVRYIKEQDTIILLSIDHMKRNKEM